MASDSGLVFESFEPADTIPDWTVLKAQNADAIWLMQRKRWGPEESARGWRIALETTEGRILTIFPRLVDEESGKVEVVVKPIATEADNKKGDDFKALLKSDGGFQMARRIKKGTTMGEMLDTITASGLSEYSLRSGRGLRFWIAATLYQLALYVVEPGVYDHLPELALCQMRRSVAPPTESDQDRQSTKDKDPNEELALRFRIIPGSILPHKCTKASLEQWTTFKERATDMIRGQEFAEFGMVVDI